MKNKKNEVRETVDSCYARLLTWKSCEPLFTVFEKEAKIILKDYIDEQFVTGLLTRAKEDLEFVARSKGWVRMSIKEDGMIRRKWVTEKDYWEHKKHNPGYRHASGEVKRAARMKVPKIRRIEIARMGTKKKVRCNED